jgi:hypothetical protein
MSSVSQALCSINVRVLNQRHLDVGTSKTVKFSRCRPKQALGDPEG